MIGALPSSVPMRFELAHEGALRLTLPASLHYTESWLGELTLRRLPEVYCGLFTIGDLASRGRYISAHLCPGHMGVHAVVGHTHTGGPCAKARDHGAQSEARTQSA